MRKGSQLLASGFRLAIATPLTCVVLWLYLGAADFYRRVSVRYGGGPGVLIWFVLFFLLGCATRRFHALPAVASSPQLAARSCP